MQMSKTANSYEIFIDRDPQLLIDRAPLWFIVVAIRKMRALAVNYEELKHVFWAELDSLSVDANEQNR